MGERGGCWGDGVEGWFQEPVEDSDNGPAARYDELPLMRAVNDGHAIQGNRLGYRRIARKAWAVF